MHTKHVAPAHGRCSESAVISKHQTRQPTPPNPEDCGAPQETLYLLSISEMRESIEGGLSASLENCSKNPAW